MRVMWWRNSEKAGTTALSGAYALVRNRVTAVIIKCSTKAIVRNPGRDMLTLLNNSFPRLIMSSERLIKSKNRGNKTE